MRKLPSLAALRAFEAAARLESFTAAGAELHLTPSAISHQVRLLERHFSRRLFDRQGRFVTPTADGRGLMGQVSQALDLMEAGCAALSPQAGTQVLSVHCAPSFASKWLGPRLPLFGRAFPGVSVGLSSSAEPPDLVRNGALDVAIVYGAPLERVGIVAEALGVEEVAALCSPGVAGVELGQQVLIQSTLSPVRWPEWFALNGLPAPAPRGGPSFDRGALAVSAAVQGAGVALESTRFAAEELASGALVRLGGGRLRSVAREMHFLCYRRAERDRPRVAAFRAWVRDGAGG